MIFRSEAKASFRDCVRCRSRTLAITRCVWRSSNGCPGTGDTALTAGTRETEEFDEDEGEFLLGRLGPEGTSVDGPSSGVLSSCARGPLGSFLGPVSRFRGPAGGATTTGHLLGRRSCSSSLGRTPPSGKSPQVCSSRMTVRRPLLVNPVLLSCCALLAARFFAFDRAISRESKTNQSKRRAFFQLKKVPDYTAMHLGS